MTASLTGRRSGARGAGSPSKGATPCRSGAWRQPRFARTPARRTDGSRRRVLQWPIREPLPRSPAHRPADRRRRRHGRAHLGGRGRPALPRGGEPPRARERRRRPRELHRGRRRADRDEHLRREPPQARPRPPRRLGSRRSTPRACGSPGRRARSPGATSSSRARSARSASSRCSTRPSTARCTRRRRASSRDVASTCSWSRRSSTSRSSVVAVEAVRGVSSLPIVALLTFDDDAEITGGVGAAAAARRLAELDVAAIGTNHGAGPTVALSRAPRDARRGPPARGAAQHRPGEPRRRPDRLPALDAGLLRRVRRAGGRARRTDRRRLLRHDAGADRGGPRGVRRGPRPPSATIEVDEPSSPSPRRRPEESGLARALREREWVVSVELDPPKGGSLEGLIESPARSARRARAASSTSTTTRWRARG